MTNMKNRIKHPRGWNKVYWMSGHYVLARLMLSGHLQSVWTCLSQSSSFYISVHSLMKTTTMIVYKPLAQYTCMENNQMFTTEIDFQFWVMLIHYVKSCNLWSEPLTVMVLSLIDFTLKIVKREASKIWTRYNNGMPVATWHCMPRWAAFMKMKCEIT